MKALKVFVVLVGVTFSCQNKKMYEFPFPAHFPDSTNVVDRNPLTHEGINLGRQLFFDPILSKDSSISCASCHFPSLAFADGKQKSVEDTDFPQRNSPALFNLAWYASFFWDGGVKNLESLSFAPLTHPNEMQVDLKSLMQALQNTSIYPEQFKAVFASDSIQSYMVSRALAQYLRTLVSANSKWDKVQMGQAEMTENELKGQQLFVQYCADCHQTPFFTDGKYYNIGLDSLWHDEREEGLMQGRFRITRDSDDLGKFRTPSLRNLKYSAPYMHDGRFATLDEVLRHYESGVLTSNQLSPKVKNLNLKLSQNEKDQLLAFLNTLNDEQFIKEGVRDSLVVY